MMEENISLDDSDKFVDAQQQYTTRQEGTSFKDIIMTHLSRISILCTKEFKEGYWEERPIKVGDTIYMSRTYKEDTRDAFNNAIQFLTILLTPKFDSDEEKRITKILSELEEKKKTTENKSEWKSVKLTYSWQIFAELSEMLARAKYFQKEGIR